MDPFGALANLILGKLKEGLWASWLRFLFELGFSATIGFLGTAGGLLMAGKPIPVAIGTGMVTAAACMLYLFLRESAKLTKNMLIAIPAAQWEEENSENIKLIQKGPQ
jgi:hypothetical protein